MTTTTDAIEVKVPDIGDFAEVPVIEIHVAEGDTVEVAKDGKPVAGVSPDAEGALAAFCLRKSERSMSTMVSSHSDWGT